MDDSNLSFMKMWDKNGKLTKEYKEQYRKKVVYDITVTMGMSFNFYNDFLWPTYVRQIVFQKLEAARKGTFNSDWTPYGGWGNMEGYKNAKQKFVNKRNTQGTLTRQKVQTTFLKEYTKIHGKKNKKSKKLLKMFKNQRHPDHGVFWYKSWLYIYPNLLKWDPYYMANPPKLDKVSWLYYYDFFDQHFNNYAEFLKNLGQKGKYKITTKDLSNKIVSKKLKPDDVVGKELFPNELLKQMVDAKYIQVPEEAKEELENWYGWRIFFKNYLYSTIHTKNLFTFDLLPYMENKIRMEEIMTVKDEYEKNLVKTFEPFINSLNNEQKKDMEDSRWKIYFLMILSQQYKYDGVDELQPKPLGPGVQVVSPEWGNEAYNVIRRLYTGSVSDGIIRVAVASDKGIGSKAIESGPLSKKEMFRLEKSLYRYFSGTEKDLLEKDIKFKESVLKELDTEILKNPNILQASNRSEIIMNLKKQIWEEVEKLKKEEESNKKKPADNTRSEAQSPGTYPTLDELMHVEPEKPTKPEDDILKYIFENSIATSEKWEKEKEKYKDQGIPGGIEHSLKRFTRTYEKIQRFDSLHKELQILVQSLVKICMGAKNIQNINKFKCEEAMNKISEVQQSIARFEKQMIKLKKLKDTTTMMDDEKYEDTLYKTYNTNSQIIGDFLENFSNNFPELGRSIFTQVVGDAGDLIGYKSDSSLELSDSDSEKTAEIPPDTPSLSIQNIDDLQNKLSKIKTAKMLLETSSRGERPAINFKETKWNCPVCDEENVKTKICKQCGFNMEEEEQMSKMMTLPKIAFTTEKEDFTSKGPPPGFEDQPLVGKVVGVEEPDDDDEEEIIPREAQILLAEAENHQDNGDFKEAIESFKKLIKYCEENEQWESLPMLNYNIADIYKSLDDKDNAIKYFKEVIKDAEDDKLIIEGYDGLIDIYSNMKGKDNEAEAYTILKKDKLEEMEKEMLRQQQERDDQLIAEIGSISEVTKKENLKKKKKKKKKGRVTSPSSIKSSSSDEEEPMPPMTGFLTIEQLKKNKEEDRIRREKQEEERKKWREEQERLKSQKREKIKQPEGSFLETVLMQEFLGMKNNTIEEFKSKTNNKNTSEVEQIIMWDSILSVLIDLEYDVLQNLDEPAMGILGGGFAAHLLTRDVEGGPYPTDDIDIKIYPVKKEDKKIVETAREKMYNYLDAKDISIRNPQRGKKANEIYEKINSKMKKLNGDEKPFLKEVMISYMYSLEGELVSLEKKSRLLRIELNGDGRKNGYTPPRRSYQTQQDLEGLYQKTMLDIDAKKKEIRKDKARTAGLYVIKIAVDINRKYKFIETFPYSKTVYYEKEFDTERKAVCDIGFWKDGHMIPSIMGLLKKDKKDGGFIHMIEKPWLPFHEYKYRGKDINLPIIHKDNLIQEKKVLVEDKELLFNSQEAIEHKTPNWNKQRELLQKITSRKKGGRTLKIRRRKKKTRKKRGGVGDEEVKFSTLEELLTLLVGLDHTVYVRKDFENECFPEPKGETIAYEMDPKNFTISRLTTEGILLAPSEDREVEGKMETRVLSWKLIKNGRIKIKRSNDTDAPFFKYVNPRRRSFGGSRKKRRRRKKSRKR